MLFQRIDRAIVWSTWCLFVVSFFLPAMNAGALPHTPSDTPLTGWEAMLAAISCVGIAPWLIFIEPRVLLFLIIPWLNLAMLLAPLCLRGDRELTRIVGVVFVRLTIFPWLLPLHLMGTLFVGFYVWSGSFLLMGLGLVAYDPDADPPSSRRRQVLTIDEPLVDWPNGFSE